MVVTPDFSLTYSNMTLNLTQLWMTEAQEGMQKECPLLFQHHKSSTQQPSMAQVYVYYPPAKMWLSQIRLMITDRDHMCLLKMKLFK